ncbi:hypothetical protein D9M70_545700 [compost metagenome]
MADRHALVDHLHARSLGAGDMFLRVVAGGLQHLDAVLDDDIEVARVRRRVDRRQQRQVHAEWLVGHIAATADFLAQRLGGRLRQRGEDAQPAGVGDGRGHFRVADPLHAALDDRVADAKQFGDSSLHDCPFCCQQAGLAGVRASLRRGAAPCFVGSDDCGRRILH